MSKRKESDRIKVSRIGAVALVVTHVVKWGGIVWCAYWFYRCIESLSGKATTANVLLQLVANLGISRWLALAFGVGGVGYGLAQRNLRRKVILRTDGRIKELETGIDPGRSSSNLDPEGRTPPV